MRFVVNLLAPVLLVLAFYVVLGGIVWLIVDRSALARFGRLWRRPVVVTQDAVAQRILLLALGCTALGVSLLFIRQSILLHFAGLQLIALALLMLVIDRILLWRIRQSERRQIFTDLTSPAPDIAAASLHIARRSGWLSDGTLAGADLNGIDWPNNDLSGADLHGADLSRANLRRTKMREANLVGAQLDRADLRSADCAWADLRVASLVGARANGVSLRGANLHRADLQDAKLNKADLRGSDLSRANLCGANLRGVDLTGTHLQHAIFDANTRWPKQIDPQLLGAQPIQQADSAIQRPSE